MSKCRAGLFKQLEGGIYSDEFIQQFIDQFIVLSFPVGLKLGLVTCPFFETLTTTVLSHKKTFEHSYMDVGLLAQAAPV